MDNRASQIVETENKQSPQQTCGWKQASMIEPTSMRAHWGTTNPTQATIPLTATCEATISDTKTMIAQRSTPTLMPSDL
jgi:hypothetical protein